MEGKQIKLTAKERVELERFCSTGVHSVRLVDRAKIVLALDVSGGRTPERHEAIAQRLGISRQTINNARSDFFTAEKTRDAIGAAESNRGIGSAHNCIGLRQSTQGMLQVDIAAVGGKMR